MSDLTPEELAELEEFKAAYRSGPKDGPPASDKFSGPFGVDDKGEVQPPEGD